MTEVIFYCIAVSLIFICLAVLVIYRALITLILFKAKSNYPQQTFRIEPKIPEILDLNTSSVRMHAGQIADFAGDINEVVRSTLSRALAEEIAKTVPVYAYRYFDGGYPVVEFEAKLRIVKDEVKYRMALKPLDHKLTKALNKEITAYIYCQRDRCNVTIANALECEYCECIRRYSS